MDVLRTSASSPDLRELYRASTGGSSGGWTADFTGPVVSVLDGDTLEVLHNDHAERIRLNGIDGPEKSVHWPEPLQTSDAG
jgi:endonuclease YncB( thermonuclease family)